MTAIGSMKLGLAFSWQPGNYDAGFRCEMPGNIVLSVVPSHSTAFGTKAKRGATWSAQVTIFDGKFTVSGYGRDEYSIKHKTANLAMRAAEAIYTDEQSKPA